jgi:hypothetical protein
MEYIEGGVVDGNMCPQIKERIVATDYTDFPQIKIKIY